MKRGDETELSRVVKPSSDLGPLFNLLPPDATDEVRSGEAFANLGSYDGPRPTVQPDPRIEWPAPSVPSETSEAAGDAVTHTKRGKEKRERDNRVLLALCASRSSGYTMPEMEAATGMKSGTVCARVLWDLVVRGWLAKTTEKRRLPNGGLAFVYVATADGIVFLATQSRAA